MRVLQVIHGFPPYYMAGSEVYTYNLSKELKKEVDVFVFTRIENPYEKQFFITDDVIDGIPVRRINKPQRDYTLKDKYLDERMDEEFRKFVKEIRPDIVHFGHLSHLSTNLVNIAKMEFKLPVIYTLHDFWLFCYRGQMIDTRGSICQGYSIDNCLMCAANTFKETVAYVDMFEYRGFLENVIKNIDIFLSPSHFLRNFFIDNGVPEEKLLYSKYGFDTEMIKYRKRSYTKDSKINFGFIGRVIPVKGVRLMLEAFKELNNQNSNLLIFGNVGKDKMFLEEYYNEQTHFKGGFKNREINDVLDQIDVLIVPSLWYENSPLVIQEAFLAGIPVVTSALGGMKELVEDGIDGFTFEVGDKNSLKSTFERIVEDPTILNNLKVDPKKVRPIKDDAEYVLEIYKKVIE